MVLYNIWRLAALACIALSVTGLPYHKTRRSADTVIKDEPELCTHLVGSSQLGTLPSPGHEVAQGSLFHVDHQTGEVCYIRQDLPGAVTEVENAAMMDVEIDKVTQHLFAAMHFYTEQSLSDETRLSELDPASGDELSSADTTPRGYQGMEFAGPTLYATRFDLALAAVLLVRLNPVTGAEELVGKAEIDALIPGLAWDTATGTMYGVTNRAARLLTLDTATGVATVLGPVMLPQAEGGKQVQRIGAIHFGPDGMLYGGTSKNSEAPGPGTLLRVNPTTLVAEPVRPPPGATRPAALSYTGLTCMAGPKPPPCYPGIIE